MSRGHSWVWLAVVALAAVFFGSGAGVGDATGDVLRIGTLLPFSGDLAEFGPAHQNAAALAAKHINEAGGVLGQEIELVPGDTATTPEIGVAEALRLIEDEGVSAIVGALASGVTLEVAENATVPNGILQISPASTSPALSTAEDNDFLFRTALSDAAQGIVLAELAQELGYERASTLYLDNAYGQGLSTVFAVEFEELSGQILATVPHEDWQASYVPELEEATAGGPDVLAAISYPQQAIVYVEEAIANGLIDEFLFVDGTKSQEMFDILGAEQFNGMCGTAPTGVDSPAGEAFDAAYEAEYGEPPPVPFMVETYDAVVLIALAAEAAGSTQPEDIRDALRAVANLPGEVVGLGAGGIGQALEQVRLGNDVDYVGASGAVDFDANGDITSGAIEVWCVEDGEIRAVRTEPVVLGALAVQIDIKPGSDPNSINLKSKGVIPVAILTTEDFDAAIVDPETVVFAGASPDHYALEDVDGEGDLDLLLHFRRQETDIMPGDTEACLTGQTYDGVLIAGCDSVRTIPEEEGDAFRGTWSGQLSDLGEEPMTVEASFGPVNDDPDDPESFLASGSFSLYQPGASETLRLPLAARFTRTGDETYDVVILASVSLHMSDPWATTMKLTGQADLAGGSLTDISLEGTWFIKLPDGTIIQGPWWSDHVNRRVVRAPEVTLGPETDLWFYGDAYVALSGPTSLPPEMRDSCIILGSMSNVVMSAVRVEMPLGMEVILPPYTDVFSPGVDWTTLFRFSDCVPLPAVPGGTYRLVALDAVGEPLPGVDMTDVWVGVDPPDPPSNVSAAVTAAGLELAWDEVPEIPGSFDPDAVPQLGFYQIGIETVAGPGPQSAYGANSIAVPSHTVPWSSADFVEGEHGLALGELPPGFYRLGLCVHSVAPEGTAGHGFEYNNSDPAESVDFQVTPEGDVIILP